MGPLISATIDLEANTVNKNFHIDRESLQDYFIKLLAPKIPKSKYIEHTGIHYNSSKEFEKEKNCLTLLEKNFINEPKINHYPFPKIINCENLNITMTYCGIDLTLLERQHRKKRSLIIKHWTQQKPRRLFIDNLDYNNLHNTIQCIINNLKINSIIHKDISKKNLCIDKNNNIHLIDFERSTIGNSKWREKKRDIYLDSAREKISEMFHCNSL